MFQRDKWKRLFKNSYIPISKLKGSYQENYPRNMDLFKNSTLLGYSLGIVKSTCILNAEYDNL